MDPTLIPTTSTPPILEPPSNKRASISKPVSRPTKKPRFNRPGDGKVTFSSKTVPRSLSLTPLKRYFQLHTSTIHLSTFFSAIYTVIVNRDYKFSATTEASFNYVCHLAFYYRLYHIGETLGYSFSSRSSALKRFAEALLLPEAVCKLIESVGMVKLANGITVVPYIPSNLEYNSSGFYATMGNLAHTIDGIERNTFKSAITADLILQYIASTTRGYKANMMFRKVMYDSPDGTMDFTVATSTEDSNLRACSLQEMEESVAHNGGTYRLRCLEDKAQWLGDDRDYFQYPFISTTFEPKLQVASKMVNELNK